MRYNGRLDTNTVVIGDCLDVLTTMPVGVVDLAFADPPISIGLQYSVYHDSLPPGKYLAWLEERFRALRRVLSPIGTLVVAIGTAYQAEVYVILKRLGFHWRNTICWHNTFGNSQKRKFTPSWTPLHYFVMHCRRFTFNADPVRVPSARLLDGDKRAKVGGKSPDDVWFVRPQHAEAEGYFDQATDVWHVRREAGTFRGRVGHVCQMPLPVLERIAKVLSNPGDLVLDPFCGTRTTLVAARQLGRRYVGIELCTETASLARRRLQAVV
jgi:DNA modification methylase